MSLPRRRLISVVLTLSATIPLLAGTRQSAHPDFSGSWVRIRDSRNFIDNGVRVGADGRQVGPLFGERVIISQNATRLRAGYEGNPNSLPPFQDFPFDRPEARTATGVERVFWEVDATTHADTLEWLRTQDTGVTVGGRPGISEDSTRLWLSSDGSLVVQERVEAWPKEAPRPASRPHVEETITYVREDPFKGLTKATVAQQITGDADKCGLAAATVSATVMRALSDGKLTLVETRSGADTAALRVTVHARINATPATPPAAIVISVVRCESSVSVEVNDGNTPPRLLYRNGKSLSGSPPDSGRWALQEIKTSVDEFTTAVRLANETRRTPAER